MGRRVRAWVPDYHGAWAMLVVPFVVGTVSGAGPTGFRWVAVPLFVTWLAGYFTYFFAVRWVRSRRKPRYLPPALAYLAVTVVAGVTVLVMRPGLAGWLAAFVVPLSLGLWLSAHRHERSVLARFSLVAAACLMTFVAFDAQAGPGTRVGRLVVLTILMAGYFWGTVLYVKTMIRERHNRAMYRASVGYHVVVLLAAAALGLVAGPGWWAFAGFFAAAAARAAVLPGHTVPVRTVGVVEIAFSAVLLVLCLVV